MVIAKDERAHRAMVEAFSERKVEKTYLAVVHGVPQPLAQIISAPIGRNTKHRTMMGVVEKGKPAVTKLEVVSSSRGFALLRVKIKTGRTHQIRVHTSYIGHPIVGDSLYGSSDDSTRCGIDRPALHAWRLRFTHPVFHQKMLFETPLPHDLVGLAKVLCLDMSSMIKTAIPKGWS